MLQFSEKRNFRFIWDNFVVSAFQLIFLSSKFSRYHRILWNLKILHAFLNRSMHIMIEHSYKKNPTGLLVGLTCYKNHFQLISMVKIISSGFLLKKNHWLMPFYNKIIFVRFSKSFLIRISLVLQKGLTGITEWLYYTTCMEFLLYICIHIHLVRYAGG